MLPSLLTYELKNTLHFVFSLRDFLSVKNSRIATILKDSRRVALHFYGFNVLMFWCSVNTDRRELTFVDFSHVHTGVVELQGSLKCREKLSEQDGVLQ